MRLLAAVCVAAATMLPAGAAGADPCYLYVANRCVVAAGDCLVAVGSVCQADVPECVVAAGSRCVVPAHGE